MHTESREHPLGHAGQSILLGLFLFVWAVDSFFLQISTILAGHLPLPGRLAVAVVIVVLAVPLARSGHAVAGHHRKTDHVVQTGAFRIVRHPLYLASLLGCLAFTVSTASLFALGVLIGMFLFYDHIAAYEERLLEADFGDAYRDYKRRTGKWVPRLN
ncbi:MAG: isoprenylcysteine carboxylmethyltransferase family protein [Candidatus Eisenbacteria bacterium]